MAKFTCRLKGKTSRNALVPSSIFFSVSRCNGDKHSLDETKRQRFTLDDSWSFVFRGHHFGGDECSKMAREDRAIRKDLADLVAIKGLAEDNDLATATARYASFTELRRQILKLSRENTNVRPPAISPIEKRKAIFLCQDALSALEQAIEQEFSSGAVDLTPVNPR